LGAVRVVARSSSGGGQGGGFVRIVSTNADALGIQHGERRKRRQHKRERFDVMNNDL
jgi:hypothetical protein